VSPDRADSTDARRALVAAYLGACFAQALRPDMRGPWWFGNWQMFTLLDQSQDEVRGDYIFLDQRSEFYSVSAAKGAAPSSPAGRVRAVIQPKNKPAAEAPPAQR